jgi:hypothetical protein
MAGNSFTVIEIDLELNVGVADVFLRGKYYDWDRPVILPL